ncbi:MAG: YceI family protein [Microthrixaceae bacterium]
MNRYAKYALVVVPLVLASLAFATRSQWSWLLEDGTPQTVGAVAPALEDLDEGSERLYRIHSDEDSSVSYSVQEVVAPSAPPRVTPAVAGDIAVDTEDPAESRVGTIVVNIEQFRSDSALRDKRIRTDFLDSSEFPMAEFKATSCQMACRIRWRATPLPS